MGKSKSRLGSASTIALFVACFVIFAIFVYRGFLFPDPLLLQGGENSRSRLILMGLRVGLPVLAVLLLSGFLFLGKRGQLLQGAVVGAIGAFLGVWLLLPIAEGLYYRSIFKNKFVGFHPYLQLAPQPLTLRENSSTEHPVRIFFLGGSTTEWKDSTGEDWPSRVEKILKPRFPELAIESYNQGKEWYSTQHILINYLLNLRRYKPDLVVVMEAINDLLHNADFNYFSVDTFKEDYSHFYGPVTRLVRRQSFYQFFGEQLSRLWYFPGRESVEVSEFPGLLSYTRNLKSIVELASLDSTRVVFMTQPNLYKESMSNEEHAALAMLNTEAVGPHKKWSFDTARRGMSAYNQALKDFAAREKISLIDLETAVPKQLQYFNDDVHYKDAAYPLVAAAVAEGLQSSLKEIAARR